MNLELLDSFNYSYPEENDGTLDSGSVALTCAFNRRGTLLAVGCNDGRIVIWDFLTRSVAKTYTNHVLSISSLSWSRDGRQILSSSTDFTVCLTDVMSGETKHQYRFPSVITRVQFHPRNKNVFLVCPMKHAPVVVTIPDEHRVLPTDGDSELNMTASYDRRGTRIYTGNSKGKILVLNSDTLKIISKFRITTGANTATPVKSIDFARRGDHFLVNSGDRIIRVFDSEDILGAEKDNREPECIQRLQDLVNRTQWKKCCFSGDGEYIVAGSSRQHALNIFDKASGNLVKILQGLKGEMLLDVAWHPIRPIVASVSSGLVSIWSHNQVENWSAFAPDFTELEENQEYDEHESEFDIEDEDKSVCGALDNEAEDIDIDVVTVEPIPALVSSDEDESVENGLFYLPVAPEVDDPEEIGWGQLEMDKEAVNPEQIQRSAPQMDNVEQPPAKLSKTIDIGFGGMQPDEIASVIESERMKSSGSSSKYRPKSLKNKMKKGSKGGKKVTKTKKGLVEERGVAVLNGREREKIAAGWYDPDVGYEEGKVESMEFGGEERDMSEVVSGVVSVVSDLVDRVSIFLDGNVES
eukprot:m.55031 g.55031  ORF g.55031 m.55031 type:complete len:581 (+) comp34445_c0_seq1:66-1808(+)